MSKITMNPITSCYLCREIHRTQHTTWTRFDLNRPPYWMFEQHQCCFNIINKVHICSLALMNMKDLLHKKFTCLRDNMEIYGSITYVEPCSLPLYLLFKTANVTETWRCHLVWWNVSYCKQLLDEVFVISGIIKVEVSVISRSLRLRLITLTKTLIIPDITKTESNNCFIIQAILIFLL